MTPKQRRQEDEFAIIVLKQTNPEWIVDILEEKKKR